jgi:hypothetical protein
MALRHDKKAREVEREEKHPRPVNSLTATRAPRSPLPRRNVQFSGPPDKDPVPLNDAPPSKEPVEDSHTDPDSRTEEKTANEDRTTYPAEGGSGVE